MRHCEGYTVTAAPPQLQPIRHCRLLMPPSGPRAGVAGNVPHAHRMQAPSLVSHEPPACADPPSLTLIILFPACLKRPAFAMLTSLALAFPEPVPRLQECPSLSLTLPKPSRLCNPISLHSICLKPFFFCAMPCSQPASLEEAPVPAAVLITLPLGVRPALFLKPRSSSRVHALLGAAAHISRQGGKSKTGTKRAAQKGTRSGSRAGGGGNCAGSHTLAELLSRVQ